MDDEGDGDVGAQGQVFLAERRLPMTQVSPTARSSPTIMMPNSRLGPGIHGRGRQPPATND